MIYLPSATRQYKSSRYLNGYKDREVKDRKAIYYETFSPLFNTII